MTKVEIGFIAYRDVKSKKFTKSEPIKVKATPELIAEKQKFDSSVIDFFIKEYRQKLLEEDLKCKK